MTKFLFLTFGKFQRSLFTLLVALSFVINESKCSEQKRRHFRQDLKTKIYDKEGIPIEQQNLFCSSTILLDNNTLADYGI